MAERAADEVYRSVAEATELDMSKCIRKLAKRPIVAEDVASARTHEAPLSSMGVGWDISVVHITALQALGFIVVDAQLRFASGAYQLLIGRSDLNYLRSLNNLFRVLIEFLNLNDHHILLYPPNGFL